MQIRNKTRRRKIKMGITAQELRKRPVLIELRLGGNEDCLQWLIQKEEEYGKLQEQSAKQVVDYMRKKDSVINANSEARSLGHEMNSFIDKTEQNQYEIISETTENMVCAILKSTGEIFKDERNQPMLDHLTAETTEDGVDIWYQGMTITKPTVLGYKQ
jgi:DNA-binding protein H-NS